MNNNINSEYEYNQYLSFVDLEEHHEWAAAWKAQDEDKVSEILYKFGCDVSNGWEIEVNLHRTRLSQQVEYGPRFTFKERTDKQWQATGMGFEDMIAAQRLFLRGDMMGMSRHVDNTQLIKEHCTKEGKQ
jgi:hypothetical protein